MGAPLRFTDHNQPLIFDDGGGPQTYVPAGGFNASARELASGLKEQNLDLLGVLSSAAITEDDLRAEKYKQATITEFLVDWRYPHGGAFRTRSYRVANTKQTGESWIAELSGLSNRLHDKAGAIFARPCGVELGGTKCGIDLDTFIDGRFDSVRVQVASQDPNEPRRIFDAVLSDLASTEDDWFNYGRLVWTTGANADAGVVSRVKDFVDTTRAITLYQPTAFDIADADRFTIFAGCDKLRTTCIAKFANIVNHRGDPFLPGSDRVLRTPNTT